MRLWLPFALVALIVAGCQPGGGKADDHDHGPAKEAAPTDEHGHAEGGDHADEPVTLTDAQRAIAGVETERVTAGSLKTGLAVPGKISETAEGHALVTPPLAGRVVALSVRPGESVQRGQTVAVIESADLADAYGRITAAALSRDEAAARVREAESGVRLTEAKLAAANQTLARQRQLAAAGAFNQAPVQQAKTELNEAQSDLLSAQKEQASHAEQLRRAERLFRDGLISRNELDAAKLEAQQDEIRVSRATARVQTAKSAYARESRIAERGLLNAREIQTAEADVRSARLERDQAKTALRSSRDLLASQNRAVQNARQAYQIAAGGSSAGPGRVNVIAPLSGVVAEFAVTRGQAVERTQTLFEIVNLNTVWATAQVPERDSASIRVGTPVEVTSTALPGQIFRGSVRVIGAKIDPKTRTLPVQCRLANLGGRLKPEMFVTVRIAGGAPQNVLAVKSSAIVTEAGRHFVFVKEGAGYEKREVKLGGVASGQTEIVSGLNGGEEVAVKGAFILNSQQKKDELKGHEH